MLAWAVFRYVTMDAAQEQVLCASLFSFVKNLFADALVLAQVYAIKFLLIGLLRAIWHGRKNYETTAWLLKFCRR